MSLPRPAPTALQTPSQLQARTSPPGEAANTPEPPPPPLPKAALDLGKDLESATEVARPVESLRQHVAILGSTGSGKTVLCKAFVEEAVRCGIAVLAVDPQGDVASLALAESTAQLSEHGGSESAQQEFFGKARIAIFTPASSKGIPISVNPLKLPGPELPREEAVLAVDMTAASIAGILGYDLASPQGKAARACLFSVMDSAVRGKAPPKDLAQLARLVADPPAGIAGDLASLVTKKEADELARKVRLLTVGAQSLLFEMGVPLDLETLLDRKDGKVPVNIVYLNSLTSETDKQFFLTMLLREVYLWMLRHPSKELQLVLYVDEVAPYIPPYPRSPPPKEAYALLFKQARKYGVSLLAATQNITDIDYKALGQVNTWCVGRLVMPQDVTRVSKIVQSIDPMHAEHILSNLPGLTTSEFFLVSPDVRDKIVRFRTRWLLSQHRTLEENELFDAMTPSTRDFYMSPAPQPAPPREARVPLGSTKPSIADALAATPAPLQEAPAPAEAPPALTTLQQSILSTLVDARAAVPAAVLAEKSQLAFDVLAAELRGLTRAGLVSTSRAGPGSEPVFWLPGDGFQPAVGLSEGILDMELRVSQVDALQRATSLLERERFLRAESVSGAELDKIPLWRVACTWTTKGRFAPAKEHARDYYVSVRSGALMSVQGRELRFDKLARDVPDRIQGLAESAQVSFSAKLPKEAGTLPPIKVSGMQAAEFLHRTFGVSTGAGRLALLPVWRLSIRRKDGSATRTVLIEGVSGRVVVGDY